MRYLNGWDALPGLSWLRDFLWSRRYSYFEWQVHRHADRVERERERLRKDLAAMNYQVIRCMHPEDRDDPDVRRRVTAWYLDTTLYTVKLRTGWQFGYEAETHHDRRYPEHLFPRGDSERDENSPD